MLKEFILLAHNLSKIKNIGIVTYSTNHLIYQSMYINLSNSGSERLSDLPVSHNQLSGRSQGFPNSKYYALIT